MLYYWSSLVSVLLTQQWDFLQRDCESMSNIAQSSFSLQSMVVSTGIRGKPGDTKILCTVISDFSINRLIVPWILSDSLVSKVIKNIQKTVFIVMMSPTKYSSMTVDFFRKQINSTTKSHDTEKEKVLFYLFLWLPNANCIKLCIKGIKHRTTLTQLQIHSFTLYIFSSSFLSSYVLSVPCSDFCRSVSCPVKS